MEAPHLLILDEPTNHLDIDSRRALLDALNDYEGAVIIITHDRSLIELVADRLWLTADGHIKPFKGDMDDYARFVLDRARAEARAPSQDTSGAWRGRGGSRPGRQRAGSPGSPGRRPQSRQKAQAAGQLGAAEVPPAAIRPPGNVQVARSAAVAI